MKITSNLLNAVFIINVSERGISDGVPRIEETVHNKCYDWLREKRHIYTRHKIIKIALTFLIDYAKLKTPYITEIVKSAANYFLRI